MKERDWAVGILKGDPEMHFTVEGKAVINFRLSLDSEEELLEITIWEYLAEACNQELNEGDKISVKGKPYTRRWKDRYGHERERVGITAYQVFLLKPESTVSVIKQIQIEREITFVP